jgi:GNAT superfamily N-acetyltransferase
LAYRIREATLDDTDVLVHHRIAMFTDMHVPLDRATLEPAFREWLAAEMPAGAYHAWVAEDAAGVVVAGGGMTVVPWPPGPNYIGNTLGFVYNMYTEPAHRHRGLASLILDAMHAWARANGVASMALNASTEGLKLYESMGYAVSRNPMMFRQL